MKFDFLNWRPDAEDLGNPGLITADNILHDTEGYNQFKTPTTGAFATNTAVGTTPSLVIRSVGTNNQRICAYLHNATAAGAGFTVQMSIGLLSSGYTTIGNYTTISSETITNQYTGNRVIAFDVTEYADQIFMVARAELPTATVLNSSNAPLANLSLTGYAAI